MYLFRLHPGGGTYDIVGSSRRSTSRSPAATASSTRSPAPARAEVARARSRPPGGPVSPTPRARRARHALVDLGRNDLQRVCDAGTVDVVEFMNVRHYSHVIHLGSTVVGHLAPEAGAYAALAATFWPAPLRCPKPRAMALIDDYEPTRRGSMAGRRLSRFPWRSRHGHRHPAAVIRDGRAYVQAGAGIIADSVPLLEYDGPATGRGRPSRHRDRRHAAHGHPVRSPQSGAGSARRGIAADRTRVVVPVALLVAGLGVVSGRRVWLTGASRTPSSGRARSPAPALRWSPASSP